MYYHDRETEIFLFILIIVVVLIIAVVHFILWIIETFKDGLKFKEVMKNKDEQIAYERNKYIKLYDNLDGLKQELKQEHLKKIREVEDLKQESKQEYLKKLREVEDLKQELQAKVSLENYELNSTMIKIFNDFYEKYLSSYEKYFYFKKNPSYRSADYIREIKADYKELQIKNKKLELLLSQFNDEKEDEIIEKEKETNSFNEENIACKYSKLNKEEWKKLSYIEKLDLIIQRYKEKWKNKLNIGLEFERYCGYLYEKNGYTVEYNGILKGKSDGGIDLIAINKEKKLYIQCKYWGVNKQIRENTITQLFGSALKKAIDDGENYNTFIEKLNSEKIRIILLTKTELSEEAKLFCRGLNILYKENIEINPNYPIIKGVSGEEKIFYIPTDLQYDNIKYKSTYKEYKRFKTCKDAEKSGYRHCYKWKGDKT